MQKKAAQGCFYAKGGYDHACPKESSRLEGNLGGLQPNACSKQDQLLNLDQINQDYGHSGLENFRGWRCPSLFGQQIPELDYSH